MDSEPQASLTWHQNRHGSRRAILAARAVLAWLPVTGVLLTWIALVPSQGGFVARDWLPAGVALAGLLALAALGTSRSLPVAVWSRRILIAFAVLIGWSLLSVLWADARGAAWETANLGVVALLGAWTLSLGDWRPRSAAIAIAAFASAVAVLCVLALAGGLAGTDLATRFVEDRWADPLGYPNGLAAICAMAALAAAALSAQPKLSWPLAGAAFGLAMLLGALALLPQSRGSVLGIAGGAAILLLLAPSRWRMLARLALAGGILAAVSGPIFAVYEAAEETGNVSPALDAAARSIIVATLVGLAAGALLALAERRIPDEPRVQTLARRTGWVAVALAVVGALALGLVNGSRISDLADRQIEALKNTGSEYVEPAGENEDDDGQVDGSRLLDADPLQRYDYWRVSAIGFQEAPMIGTGAGNFARLYAQERDFEKNSKHPHNLLWRALGETGFVGFVGLLAVIVFTGWGLLAARRTASDGVRALLAAAGASSAYFLVHAQFDWLEAFPTMAGPAIAFPLIVLAAASAETTAEADAEAGKDPRRGEGDGSRARVLRARVLATGPAIALLVAVAAGISLTPPWLASRFQERAQQGWRADPDGASRDLDRAETLNPLAASPLLVRGTIAIERRDLDGAEAAFREALEREPQWLARFELALIEGARGDKDAALAELAKARMLNPREPVLIPAREDLEAGKKIDPSAFNRRMFSSPLFKSRKLF